MQLWTAFLIGLIGSVHCAGMCGPLALAIPSNGNTTVSFAAGRLLYNGGRLTTYSILGAVFGFISHTFVLAGLQRWLSLAAGIAILTVLAASSKYALNTPLYRAVGALKSRLGRLLQKRTLGSLYSLGLLNGLLPCGLVYAACAGAAAAGGFVAGIEFMFAFGLGTIPMMLAIGLAGKKLQLKFAWKVQRFIPACLVLLGILLIVRGLALGIPYLSPDLAATGSSPSCH